MMDNVTPRDFDQEFALLLEQDRDAGLARFESSMVRVRQALMERYAGTLGEGVAFADTLMGRLNAEWPFYGAEAIVTGFVHLDTREDETTIPQYFGAPVGDDQKGRFRYDTSDIAFESRGVGFDFEQDQDGNIIDVKMYYLFAHTPVGRGTGSREIDFIAYQGEVVSQAYAEVSHAEAVQRLAEQWPTEFELINEALYASPRGLLAQRLTTLVELLEVALQNEAFVMYLEAYLSEYLQTKSPFLVAMIDKFTLSEDDPEEDAGYTEWQTVRLDGMLTEPLHGIQATFTKRQGESPLLQINGARLNNLDASKEYVAVDIENVQLLLSLRGTESLGSRALRGAYEQAGGDRVLIEQASQLLEASEAVSLNPEVLDQIPDHVEQARLYSETLQEIARKVQHGSMLRFLDKEVAIEQVRKQAGTIEQLLESAGLKDTEIQVSAEGPGVLVPVYDIENIQDESVRSTIITSSIEATQRAQRADEAWTGRIVGNITRLVAHQDGGQVTYSAESLFRILHEQTSVSLHAADSVQVALTKYASAIINKDTNITVPVWELYSTTRDTIQGVKNIYNDPELTACLISLHDEILTADATAYTPLSDPRIFDAISSGFESAQRRDGAHKLLEGLTQVLVRRSYIRIDDSYKITEGALTPTPDTGEHIDPFAQIVDIRNDLTSDGLFVIVAAYNDDGKTAITYLPLSEAFKIHF